MKLLINVTCVIVMVLSVCGVATVAALDSAQATQTPLIVSDSRLPSVTPTIPLPPTTPQPAQ